MCGDKGINNCNDFNVNINHLSLNQVKREVNELITEETDSIYFFRLPQKLNKKNNIFLIDLKNGNNKCDFRIWINYWFGIIFVIGKFNLTHIRIYLLQCIVFMFIMTLFLTKIKYLCKKRTCRNYSVLYQGQNEIEIGEKMYSNYLFIYLPISKNISKYGNIKM